MTPAEAARILAEVGLLTITARHGDRVEYRVTQGAECLFPLPEGGSPTTQLELSGPPTDDNRPWWAYRPGDHAD